VQDRQRIRRKRDCAVRGSGVTRSILLIVVNMRKGRVIVVEMIRRTQCRDVDRCDDFSAGRIRWKGKRRTVMQVLQSTSDAPYSLFQCRGRFPVTSLYQSGQGLARSGITQEPAARSPINNPKTRRRGTPRAQLVSYPGASLMVFPVFLQTPPEQAVPGSDMQQGFDPRGDSTDVYITDAGSSKVTRISFSVHIICKSHHEVDRSFLPPNCLAGHRHYCCTSKSARTIFEVLPWSTSIFPRG